VLVLSAAVLVIVIELALFAEIVAWMRLLKAGFGFRVKEVQSSSSKKSRFEVQGLSFRI